MINREFSLAGSLIDKAHELVREVVQPGDSVVDATVGNGHDTLFLAQCVGSDGKVIGFDVQQEAIVSTRERLIESGMAASTYELHLQCHSEILQHAPSCLRAVMFNLGYLPGGNKKKITQINSTIKALADSLELLESGGVVTVMCYPGHAGGDDEAEAVKSFLGAKHGKNFAVSCFSRASSTETTPFLVFVKKY